MPDVRRVLRREHSGPLEHFYQCLLQLDRHTGDVSILDDALRSLVELTGVRLAYVEVLRGDDGQALSRSYSVAQQSHESITAMVAHGIVAKAIAERRTITLDRRASESSMGATLCIPISSELVTGVLWLQGKASAFSKLDRERAERLAARLVDLRLGEAARRTLKEEVHALYDRRVREALRRCHGNISEAARELGVSRSFIHDILKRGQDRIRYCA